MPNPSAAVVVPDAASSTSQRDAVLRTAARLFREKGYERTTVRDVAKAVGLQSGSLFHHFASKTEILAEVMEQGLALSDAMLTRAVAEAADPEARLEALFRGYLIAMLSEECRDYMTVLLYDFRSLPPELALRVKRVRGALEERCQSDLERALPPEQGRYRRRLTGKFVFGAMCWALQWYNPKGPLTLDELAEQFTDLAFSTCGLARTRRAQASPARRARAQAVRA
jgi:AcrR family transcriptional regulator